MRVPTLTHGKNEAVVGYRGDGKVGSVSMGELEGEGVEGGELDLQGSNVVECPDIQYLISYTSYV